MTITQTQRFQKLKTGITSVLILLVALYTLLAVTIPDRLATWIGYRPYIILTDSMKDTLPPGTLVIDRTITLDTFHTLAPGDIITFKVDDLREGEIFTHYYRELQSTPDGLWVRTQSEISDRYDDYSTTPTDVIGDVWTPLSTSSKGICPCPSPCVWTISTSRGANSRASSSTPMPRPSPVP